MKSFFKTFALLAVVASFSSSYALDADMGDVGTLAEKTSIVFGTADIGGDLGSLMQAAVITQTGTGGWAAIEQDSTGSNIAYILQNAGGANPTYAFINQTSNATGNIAIINQK